MKPTREIWSYVFVTIVTILIWFWAAGETREEQTFESITIEFTTSEPAKWVIKPAQQRVRLEIEGSVPALERAENLFRRPIRVSLAPTVGTQTIDLTSKLGNLEAITSAGVSVVRTDPEDIEITMDQLNRSIAKVKPILPGVRTEGEIEVTPPTALVTMPGQIRSRYPEELVLEATAGRQELERLEPGLRHSIEITPRITGTSTTNGDVIIEPNKVTLAFKVRSRTRDVILENVPIQVAGPGYGQARYRIEFEPAQLRSVEITADADLVGRIELGEASVYAVVQLTTRDLEERITSKSVSYFVAIVPNPNGEVQGVPIPATFDEIAHAPRVHLRISDR